MKRDTMLSHFAEEREEHLGAVVPPIFQNSLFTFPSLDAIDAAFEAPVSNCIYTRGRNPSVALAEEKIAHLCGAEKAKLFSSGMAAISSAIMHFLEAGDHVVAVKNLYGPTSNFLDVYLRRKLGIEVTFVDGTRTAAFQEGIRTNTRLIYLESPASLVFALQDIQAVCSLARARGIATVIDNTWATPVYQRPLELGADLEVHSCSKYLGGHSDIVAGVVAGAASHIDAIFLEEHALFGGKMAPFEAWLLTRSLRTLPLRLERHQRNAMAVAAFLEKHPKVERVYYPGLPSFPQLELAQRQMQGFTGLLSFNLTTGGSVERVKKFVEALRYFQIGVSWGGHESLVYPPGISYAKELSPERFRALGISIGTIRLSVGLEDISDLLEDLSQALDRLD